jgi:hypothetical protein
MALEPPLLVSDFQAESAADKFVGIEFGKTKIPTKNTNKMSGCQGTGLNGNGRKLLKILCPSRPYGR